MAGTHSDGSKVVSDSKETESPLLPPVVTDAPPPPAAAEDREKWGTHIMGRPAVPTVHPDNQKAALWKAADHREIPHQPYVHYDPIERPSSNPLEPVIHAFNSWSNKAETIARNIWHNLKTGESVSGAAWGKLNLTAKAITEGGFEALFKQLFVTEPDEKLKKTFACYLSTSTGPVAGTLYLSTRRVAFCSDRPLCFTAPSGQEAWSYYKAMIPIVNVSAVNPVVMRENPAEKYLQIVTTDGHDFWFMGFVNFEKASQHLHASILETRAA
ncbi:hypothetical protein MLD38_007415 [Melastoma candidum]|uniref:Uncharacterized protein n=1 Tax=Melastoma candidum TaxID=119954 RepID=A0ACB9RU26_9MYRT|nr:hypothetical protein MLD38_007415 [Melastoma candidum]